MHTCKHIPADTVSSDEHISHQHCHLRIGDVGQLVLDNRIHGGIIALDILLRLGCILTAGRNEDFDSQQVSTIDRAMVC